MCRVFYILACFLQIYSKK